MKEAIALVQNLAALLIAGLVVVTAITVFWKRREAKRKAWERMSERQAQKAHRELMRGRKPR